MSRSKICPFIEGEDPRKRHARRLDVNLELQESIRAWCSERGIRLTITNEGHHWRFVKGKQHADWWPSSAKLILQSRWRREKHTHDVEQAKARIAAHLAKETP